MNWRDVPGYEGFYKVSDCGQVLSVERRVPHRNGPKRVAERVLRQNTDKDGYKTVVLQKFGRTKTLKVHRLVALTFLGCSSLQVNHIDMNKANNLLSNLEFVTLKENAQHARKHKTYNARKGAEHHCYKITPQIRAEIISMIKSGHKRPAVAAKFGVHKMTTYKITKGAI